MGFIIDAVGAGVGAVLSKKSGKKQARDTEAAARLAADQVAPFRETGVDASRLLGGAVGIGDPAAAGESSEAFRNFLASPGFRTALEQGSRAITGNAAAAGLLNSGATLKALNRFGQGEAEKGFVNFLNILNQLSGRGLAAGQTAGAALGEGGLQAANARAAGRAGFSSGVGQAFEAFRPVFSGVRSQVGTGISPVNVASRRVPVGNFLSELR